MDKQVTDGKSSEAPQKDRLFRILDELAENMKEQEKAAEILETLKEKKRKLLEEKGIIEARLGFGQNGSYQGILGTMETIQPKGKGEMQ